MSHHVLSFQQGDKVLYTGTKHKQELTRDGKSLIGWVHAAVGNDPESYVVFWPETKEQDSYVMHHSVLTRWVKSDKSEGPDIQPRRKKREDD